MREVVRLYYKVIVWVLIVSYLFLVNGDGFKKVHVDIPHLDKIVHFTIFFILGVLLYAIAYKKQTNFHLKWLPSIAIAYGGVIEIVQQQLIATSSGDILDWLVDIVGLVVGIVIFKYLPQVVKRVLLA